jgi:hypothetical protein
MRRWTKVFELLGVNSIPVVGVLFGDWSNSTALAVYWLENLIASLLVASRLALHRRWQEAPAPGTRSALARRPGELLITAIPFTLAHGFFLGFIFLMVTKLTPDLQQLQRAAVALIAFQGLAFGIDLWTLGSWPAARVNERADHLMGRVVLVHLSIIIGMFLFMWLERPGAFFGFFVGCKVLGDLATFLPTLNQGTPEAPPRWLAAIMRRLPKQKGETFEEYWVRTHKAEAGGAAPAAAPREPEPRIVGAERQTMSAKALSRRAARRARRR